VTRLEPPIRRQRLAGTHEQAVAGAKGRRGNAFPFGIRAFAQARRGLRHEPREVRERERGARAGEHLEIAAGEEEEDKHRHRVEIHGARRGDRRPGARGERGREAQRHGDIHSQARAAHVAPRPEKNGAAEYSITGSVRTRPAQRMSASASVPTSPSAAM
jgi:hypothetical protein